MTADRARGALAVLQDADGKFICEVPCGYIVEQTASAHKPRRDTGTTTAAGNASPSRRPYGCVADRRRPSCGAYAVERERCGRTSRRIRPPERLKRYTSRPPFFFLRAGRWPGYVPNAAEVEALAKLIYGEAGIVPSTTEQAAVVWCVLNRVDDPRFPDTVLEVIEAPYQFSGYDPEYPVKEEFALLAADVLTRYRAERDGEENVGRVLPAEYCFFTGDGRRNHFTTEWKSTDCFGWTLESPYTD